jgi:hypothetical protein
MRPEPYLRHADRPPDRRPHSFRFRREPAMKIRSCVLSALLVGLLSTPGLMACGGDDAVVPPPTCTGAGCTCADSSCTCAAGADCHTECGDNACSLDCTTAAKCNGDTNGALTLDCVDTSECKGNGGPGSHITCSAMAHCDLKAGDDSTATCSDDSDCKINLGDGSTVTCEDTAHCDIKCDADCVVTCAATASCSVTCGASDGGVAGMTCPDGREVCGTSC